MADVLRPKAPIAVEKRGIYAGVRQPVGVRLIDSLSAASQNKVIADVGIRISSSSSICR
jgi:hypothetical protein